MQSLLYNSTPKIYPKNVNKYAKFLKMQVYTYHFLSVRVKYEGNDLNVQKLLFKYTVVFTYNVKIGLKYRYINMK